MIVHRAVEEISERVWNANATWHYRYVCKTSDGYKLQVSIRRNAYDNQSEAAVSVWSSSDLSWNRVVSAPITQLECASISYIHMNITPAHFCVDAGNLLSEALEILS